MSESFSRSDKRANDPLVVLLAERLDISFDLQTEQVLAAINPAALSLGVMAQSGEHLLRTARRSWWSSFRVGLSKNQEPEAVVRFINDRAGLENDRWGNGVLRLLRVDHAGTYRSRLLGPSAILHRVCA